MFRLLPIFLFLSIASGCSHRSKWKQGNIPGASAEFSSSRISYREEENGPCFELIQTKFGIKGYITTRGKPFPSGEIPVRIQKGKEEKTFLSKRYEGGQKLRFPDEAIRFLLESSQDTLPVMIHVGESMMTIDPKELQKYLLQARRAFSISDFCKLPF